MKRTKVLLFVLVLVMFGLFFSGAKFRAVEIQTSDEITVLGAQVRTDDPLGIRFVGTTKGEYDKYGIAIAFGDVDVNEIVLGATVNGKAVLNAEASEKDEDGQFYISLISIPENMYGQKVTARAYVKNGEDVTYAKTATTRSYYGTAKLAYEAGDKSDKVSEVYNNLPKTTFDYNGGEVVADYEFVITRNGANSNIAGNGYNVTIAPAAKIGNACNLYWYRIFVKAENIQNVYKVVDVASVTNPTTAHTTKDYDYVLAVHDNCTDETSQTQFTKIVKAANATDYYLSFEAPVNTECNVVVKASTNPEELMNSGTYYDLGDDLPSGKKENYGFIGWYDNEELTGSRTLVYTGASKYYAKYAPTYYHIYYYMNGGDCHVAFANSYCVESDEILLPDASSMTIDNGYFLGWYDNSAFTGDPITTLDTSKGGDVHLYAKWFINTKTVVELSTADIAALNALEPTIVVSSAFENGTYEVNGNDYVMNDTAFASVADACSVAPENAKIYVFPGTYSDELTIGLSGITLYGPNYNISGQNNLRNISEAIISGLTNISAANVTLNGLKFVAPIKVGANNVVITNSYIAPTYTVACNGNNRQGCIVDSTAISYLTVSNNYIFPNTANTYSGITNQYMSFTNVSNLIITGNYIINKNCTTTSGSGQYSGMRIYNLSGTLTITNNEFRWATGGFLMILASSSNKATQININENIFDGNGVVNITAGIQLYKASSSTCKINIVGNVYNNFSGNVYKVNASDAGTWFIGYNNFATTKFKMDTLASATSAKFTFSNNYYGVAQTTKTSDYGVITSVAALETEYAKYKAQ